MFNAEVVCPGLVVTAGPGAGGGGGRAGGQADQRRVQSPQSAALRRQAQAGDQVQQLGQTHKYDFNVAGAAWPAE